MEDVPIIIFVLLFILVLILIFLHRSNKKFADKISVLEQTVELKAESLSSMKEIYTESKKVLEKSQHQEKDIESKKKVILELEETKSSLENSMQKKIGEMQQLEHIHENIIEEVTQKIFDIEKASAEKDDANNALKMIHKEAVEKLEEKHLLLTQTLMQREEAIKTLELAHQKTKEKNQKEKDALLENIKTLKAEHFEILEQAKEEKESLEKLLMLEQENVLQMKERDCIALEKAEASRLLRENIIQEKEADFISFEEKYNESMRVNQEKIQVLENRILEKEKKLTALIEDHKDEINKMKVTEASLQKALVLEKETISQHKMAQSKEREDAENMRLAQEKQIVVLLEASQTRDNENIQQKNILEKQIETQQYELEKLQVAYDNVLEVSEKQHKMLLQKEKDIKTLYRGKGSLDTRRVQSDVMRCIRQGESKQSVAKKLAMPIKRVELIIKFDKIKKVKLSEQ